MLKVYQQPLRCCAVQGIEFLQQIQSGDMITSARLTSGQDRLVIPGSQA